MSERKQYQILVQSSAVSEFKLLRKLEKPPMTLLVPESVTCTGDYSINGLLEWLYGEFVSLRMQVLEQKNRSDIGGYHLLISAKENTWVHRRRRRREIERQMRDSGVQGTPERSVEQEEEPQPEPMEEESTPPASPAVASQAGQKRPINQADFNSSEKRPKLHPVTEEQAQEADAWIESHENDQDSALQALAKVAVAPEEASSSAPMEQSRREPILLANVFVERAPNPKEPENGRPHQVDEGHETSTDEESQDGGDSAVDETPVRFVIKVYDLNNNAPNSRDILHQLILYLRNRIV
ncbi:Methyltransferase-like protein 16 [Cichlidogyrus casuarinus]|uniref:Methyltransferase-like protein 16 n=1 Tax=Cichlidogyrus casuarinus TaxID=1844966 RepID=A0ABD2PY24_9PLAT